MKGGDAMRRKLASRAHAYRHEGQKREEPLTASVEDSMSGSW
jgi:hypothetical protein